MRIFNPLKVMGWWISLIVMIDLVAIPCFYLHAVQTARSPLTFMVSSIRIAIDGLFVLGILAAIVYFKQFKRFWTANCFLLLVLGIFAFRDLANAASIKYVIKERIDSIGGYLIKTRTEYYSVEGNKVRSRCYWKNDQKDSVWTVYSETGRVLEQQLYSNGVLIR